MSPLLGILSSGGLAPGAPTIGTATAGTASATVAFTAPTYTGKGSGTVTYTATSSPGNITGTATSSPITVSGLTNGTAYTFTVKATTSYGVTGPSSAASNSITPVSPYYFSDISTNTFNLNSAFYGLSSDSSNNIYATGEYDITNQTNQSIELLKTTLDGTISASKSIKYSSFRNYSYDVIVASSGNIYIAAAYIDNNIYNTMITKLTSAFANSWTYKDAYSYGTITREIELDSSENVYYANSYYDSNADVQYLDIIKRNSAGTFQWGNRYNASGPTGSRVYPYDMSTSPNGTTWFVGYNQYSGSNANGCIGSVSSAGSANTTYCIATSGNPGDYATSVYATNSEVYAGFYSGQSSAPGAHIMKLTTGSSVTWTKRTGTANAFPEAITADSSGNVYVGINDGTSANVVYIVKYNSSGVMQWQRKLNNSYQLYITRIAIVDNKIVISGRGNTQSNPSDAYTAVLANDGSGTGTIYINGYPVTYSVSSMVDTTGLGLTTTSLNTSSTTPSSSTFTPTITDTTTLTQTKTSF